MYMQQIMQKQSKNMKTGKKYDRIYIKIENLSGIFLI